MGLYLALFENDDEIDGIEIGRYSDFGYFRDIIIDKLEKGQIGSRFPTLILHSDCDGEWSSAQCKTLKEELIIIGKEFKKLPIVDFQSDWQKMVAKTIGLKPQCLYDCFIDVDGESLIERLIALCELAVKIDRPILFQ